MRLRELRLGAGLTGRKLAQLCGWSESKISKIEYGRQTPSEADVKAWCRHTDSMDQLRDLVATLRNIEAAYMEFQRVLGTGTKRRQNLLRHIESETQIVRWFEPIIIPGVLQTPEYIEWILSQVIGFYGIPDDLEQGVAARVERQKVLYDRRKRFSFIIAEQALHTSAGSDEVMIGQLDRLLTAMSLPRVNVAILPQQAAYRAPTVHGFVMYDKRIVLVETVSAELTVTQPAEIGLYGKAFDTLTRQAVTGEQARALIRKAIDARGNR